MKSMSSVMLRKAGERSFTGSGDRNWLDKGVSFAVLGT